MNSLASYPATQPLFGQGSLEGPGERLDFSSRSEILALPDFSAEARQAFVQEKINDSLSNWAYGNYLDEKEDFFRRFGADQMVLQRRWYHLGFDVYRPVGTTLFAPLEGEVVVSEYEAGSGNYGGMVCLQHEFEDRLFYSVYGHLNPESLPELGTALSAGQALARLGGVEVNGGYAPHVHLQILTESGFQSGWVHRGYCTQENLETLPNYCLNPDFFFTS